MSSKTHNGISEQRVIDLIEAYGGNTDCWPGHERLAALNMIESSPTLQALLDEAHMLDAALLEGAIDEQPDPELLQRIVADLPPQQPAERVGMRRGGSLRWPAAMAAGLACLAVVLMVMNGTQQEMPVQQIALQELDYLLWEEVTDQVSFDTSEEQPADFLSML